MDTLLASDALRDKYEELREQFREKLDGISQRVLNGGEKASDEEKRELETMKEQLNERKEDYEAQRDLERMAAGTEPISKAEADVDRAVLASSGDTESMRRAVRDAGGVEALRAYDERSGAQLRDFAQLAETGDKRMKVNLNPGAAQNLAMLKELGVTPSDYVAALRAGELMIADLLEDGTRDVRLYNVTSSGEGKELVPTFWDNSLYLFASYIGGVQVSGASVIPVLGNNQLKMPKVTAYAVGLNITSEGAPLTDSTDDTTGTTDLTPRPYRGFSAETDEIMRAAAIDVRMMLVLRGLSRALNLGKENDFHNGAGSTSNEPKGILNGVAAGRIQKTGGNTTLPRYGDLPGALAKLDAEYHAAARMGSLVSLMHSSIWFTGYVGAVSAMDGQPLYPHLAQGMRELFTSRVEFSHAMAQAAAANALLVCTGNFTDAYVIATMGTQAIEVTDDLRFLSFERVYRIQEYCDGQVRDANALAYVQSAA